MDSVEIQITTKKGRVKTVEVEKHVIYDALAELCELTESGPVNTWVLNNDAGGFKYMLTKFGFIRKGLV